MCNLYNSVVRRRQKYVQDGIENLTCWSAFSLITLVSQTWVE